ncbi:MAG: GatB/YqeY domain-containing protein [Alphaproteobacteria bacterium]|nr:GatB/YqeY domain-containing protein [Alphaproteobacteria bacterium]
MSSLRAQFSDGLKEAMRAKDQRRVSTLRLILAALKDRDIAARTDGRNEGVGEEEVLQLLQKMIKQRTESIETYEKAGRIDLVEQETEEREIIESYLPRQLSASETRAAAEAVIADLGAAGLKDMGRTMTELKTRYAGQMDFGKASAVVKELLSAA